MERALISGTIVQTPYFDWLSSHVSLHEWTEDFPFSSGDQATLKGHLYMSLSDNNLNNYPVGSTYWKKIY